jgi:hypothetical protein
MSRHLRSNRPGCPKVPQHGKSPLLHRFHPSTRHPTIRLLHSSLSNTNRIRPSTRNNLLPAGAHRPQGDPRLRYG